MPPGVVRVQKNLEGKCTSVPAGAAPREAGDDGRQLVRVHGLGHVGLEAGEQGAFPVLDAGEGGQGRGREIPWPSDSPSPGG